MPFGYACSSAKARGTASGRERGGGGGGHLVYDLCVFSARDGVGRVRCVVFRSGDGAAARERTKVHAPSQDPSTLAHTLPLTVMET